MIDLLLVAAVGFMKNIVGIATRPYETYRRMSTRANVFELVFIALIVALYFAASAIVKTASFRPFLLTREFLILFGGAGIGFVLTLGVFVTVGRLLGGVGNLSTLAVLWGYTLLPTTFWFLATSFLYLILPPPRTDSAAGVAFSIVYLVFSSMLLAWKVTLGYLTLRFGMKLDLARICGVIAAAAVVWGLYSLFMYRLGIFRIPFL
jgi:hypothetical protein